MWKINTRESQTNSPISTNSSLAKAIRISESLNFMMLSRQQLHWIHLNQVH